LNSVLENAMLLTYPYDKEKQLIIKIGVFIIFSIVAIAILITFGLYPGSSFSA